MKKIINELKNKSITELEMQIKTQKEEIAKFILKNKVNSIKDTNQLVKKRKYLAQMLTVLTLKREILTVSKLKPKN